jgi:hypothetical protein
MQTTKRYVVVGFLVIAVLIAGCTGGGDEEPVDDMNTTQQVAVTQQDGLTLTFQSVQQTYNEGEPVVLELGMENTGQKMANGIQTELYGADFIAQEPPQFAGKSSLRPVDTPSNQPGESTTVTWQISNPVNLDSGFSETFPANVRVKYNYQTTATASFTAVSGRDYSGSGSPITTRTTAGPLTVDVNMDSPTPIYPGDGSRTEISVPLVITNQGDGDVADINGEPRPVHILNAEFPNTDRASLDCPPTVNLYDNTRRIICTASMPSDVFEQEFMVQFDLGYDYFETQQTTFAVQGIEGDQSAR